MAKRTILVDDMNGAEGAKTRTFSVDGTLYEIDLTDESLNQLKHAVEAYAKNSRVVRRKRPRYGDAKDRRDRLKHVRDWANSNGYNVSQFGTVPLNIQRAYETANGNSN